jgi:hypothetical protein
MAKSGELYDVLSFVEIVEKAGMPRYYDFAINRRPLSAILREQGANPTAGIFGWQESKVELRYALQLLLRERSELPSERVPLYICERCADLGCQSIAVKVSEYEECVVWSALAYDDNNQAPSPDEPESSFPDLRAYYFLRTQYEEALDRFSAGRRMKPAR